MIKFFPLILAAVFALTAGPAAVEVVGAYAIGVADGIAADLESML